MKKIINVVFALLGVVLIVFGIFIHKNNVEFMEKAEQTTATITRIETYYSGDDKKYDVYVRYEVDGEEYNAELNEYNSTMYEGERITVYYDPENPAKVETSSANWAHWIVIAIGGLFVLLGVIPLILGISKSKKAKRLKETGQKIDAAIERVDVNWNYMVNGRHPYKIYCTAVINGAVYSFVSDNIWFAIQPVIENFNITTIPVYYNPENPKEYTMDVDSLKHHLGI